MLSSAGIRTTTAPDLAVSVVVVSYNVAGHLRRCLAALHDAAEIIVVDNASADDSATLVRREFPAVQLVELPQNRGFSSAVNEGARRATGELLLVLNPDTVLPGGALTKMRAAMAARPRAGALGFRQVDGHGAFQLSLGPPPSLILELGRKLVQARLDRGDTTVAALVELFLRKPRRVPWVSGAAMLVRRAAFDAIAGFDEGFFLYFEDIDFCLRLRAAGWQVVYDPSLTLVHLRGESARQSAELAAGAYRESQLYFWEKHRGRLVRAVVERYLRWRGLAPDGEGG